MSDPVRSSDRLPLEGVSQETVEAVGKLSEAFEYVERARGHLYSFHQLSGHADLALGEAVDQLRDAGHTALADRIEQDLVGRNVVDGRWTFQLVEEYDDTYYELFRAVERESRSLTNGVRHAYEAQLKDKRRTRGHPDHTADPR